MHRVELLEAGACVAVVELHAVPGAGEGLVWLASCGAAAWFEVLEVEPGARPRLHVKLRPDWGSPEGDP